MKIITDRFEYEELSLLDLSKIEKVARDMAWNDTINVLLDNDKKSIDDFSKKGLSEYQSAIKKEAEKLMEADVEKKDFYMHISQNLIPQELWHINFSMLKPDFRKSALAFINKGIEKKKEQPRTGYWFVIKDKNTGKVIGATMLSTRVLEKNGKLIVGHSGQFIHPESQRKGIISDTKAVMVDFMYKYLIDDQKANVPQDALFYTTCDVLNRGSRRLQEKSGARCINPDNPENGKFLFIATREEITSSPLFSRNIPWTAVTENGVNFHSSTKPSYSFSVGLNLNKSKEIS